MLRIENAIVPHKGMTHIVIDRKRYPASEPDDEVVKTCGIVHSGEGLVDFLDCPVASRWTILRSR